MSEAFVLGLIGVVVAGFVLWPLLRPRQDRAATPGSPARSGAAISDELAELELDRAMGRVSEADYARWKGELDTDEADRVMPNEASVAVDATERAEALVRKWREAPRPRCPTCGERPEAEARFCSNCGASLGV